MELVTNFTDWAGRQGVYAIYNKESGKYYVGSAMVAWSDRDKYRRRIRCLSIRLREHKTNLQKNRHGNNHLQRAWNRYGEPAFEFYILEVVENNDGLLEREQYWIDHLKAYGEGYNQRPQAASNAGYKWSKQQRQQRSGEHHPMYGKKHSEESRAKISQAGKGRCGHLHHNFGKKIHSDETRKRISELKQGNLYNLGKKRTDEFKKQQSERKKGKQIAFRTGSLSPYKGVSKSRSKWQATIWKDGKRYILGYMPDQESAARLYDYYAMKLYGTAAILNFPDHDYADFVPPRQVKGLD